MNQLIYYLVFLIANCSAEEENYHGRFTCDEYSVVIDSANIVDEKYIEIITGYYKSVEYIDEDVFNAVQKKYKNDSLNPPKSNSLITIILIFAALNDEQKNVGDFSLTEENSDLIYYYYLKFRGDYFCLMKDLFERDKNSLQLSLNLLGYQMNNRFTRDEIIKLKTKDIDSFNSEIVEIVYDNILSE